MTLDELCARIRAMPAGGVEILTRAAFDATFASRSELEDRKYEAVALAERCGCGTTFIGTEHLLVRFTRRQDLGPFR